MGGVWEICGRCGGRETHRDKDQDNPEGKVFEGRGKVPSEEPVELLHKHL